MKASIALSILAGLVATVHAGCYSGGEPWGDREDALKVARDACNNNLKGKYGPKGQTSGERSVCKDANDKRNEFQIWHMQAGERELGYDECYYGLSKEIFGCEYGGRSEYKNWQYRADPNAGNC